MSYIIWDFDNTLAHRPGLWGQCLADTVNSAMPGAGLTREHFAGHLANGFPWHNPELEHHHLSDPDVWWENLTRVFAAAIETVTAVPPATAFEIARFVRPEYLDAAGWVVFPDTEPALNTLTRHGWRHLILSNHVPELPQLVEALGIGHYFEHIFTSATLGFEKPHPAAFKAAIAAIPREYRMVMVGDSFKADFKGAKAVGLEAILVRGSDPECDFSCPDLYALPPAIGDASEP
jgi:putative hydrolase of the HAD superfamily